jgi:DNA invertase Pin-like site-specific DNA recombinase
MAEYESNLISERTKDGMRAAQARGVSFGPHSWNFTAETRLKAATNARRSHIDRAKEAYADIAPDAVLLRAKGKSWTSIARYLNQQGHVTRRGGLWAIASVQRLVDVGPVP